MILPQVVQTAWLAVQTAIMHEIREQFLYKGKAIFGPHFNLDKLVELCGQPDGFSVRKEGDAS